MAPPLSQNDRDKVDSAIYMFGCAGVMLVIYLCDGTAYEKYSWWVVPIWLFGSAVLGFLVILVRLMVTRLIRSWREHRSD